MSKQMCVHVFFKIIENHVGGVLDGVLASSAVHRGFIGGVLVGMLASSAVGRGFTDYKNCICCFSAKQAALRRKSKDLLSRKQDNMSEWGNMSISLWTVVSVS